MPDVRKATAADTRPLGAALARSFHDDPVMAHLFPPSRLDSRLEKFFTFEVGSMLKHDDVWTTADGVRGGALWAPPGKWRQPISEMVKSLPALLPVFATRMARGLRALTTIEKQHPRDDHYYLAVLGTEPAMQGKGVGSALLRPVLDRCDEQGVGAYLESSKESNIAFYARHGFEVTGEVALPANGPKVWLMWRNPRSA